MRAQEIVERVIAQLGRQGGFAVVHEAASANLRWANSTLTTNGINASQQVTVVAYASKPEAGPDSGASGAATGVVRTDEDLAQLTYRARQLAAAADPAEDFTTPYAPTSRGADADWDQAPDATSPSQLAPVAQLLADVLPTGRGEGVEHFGYAEHTVTTLYLGTSTGIRARRVAPEARFELCGKSHARTRSAWAGRAGTDFASMDLTSAPTEVAAGLRHQARHVPVPPGHHTAILSPSATADLLIYLLWSASARDALDGRSALRGPAGTTAIGRRLSSLPVSVRSDPHQTEVAAPDLVIAPESGPLTSPYDTGMPVPPVDWIADGQLRALATTRHSAARAGIANTPLGENLLVSVPGHEGDLAELAARVGEGLLLTCLWYIREVDLQTLLLTGLTRDGVYVVRGGEIVGATDNFRFNESPVGMLDRLRDAGSAQRCLPREWADWFSRALTAPLVIADFNFSTPSDAT